jgi:hypothetical protein
MATVRRLARHTFTACAALSLGAWETYREHLFCLWSAVTIEGESDRHEVK